MPRTRQVGNYDDIIGELNDRIGKLERRLQAVVDARRSPQLFSFAGPLPEGVESPPWRPVHPTEIDLLVPQVLTAPSGGDLVIDMKLNGSTVRTLTVPDGELYVEDAVPFVIPAGGSLTATVTTASGAADLAIGLIPKLL